MRKLSLIAVLLLATVSAAQTKSPVLVELFTSEGCSSCPPADQLLFRLEQQPVPNTEIIVLGEHVDYWDHDGWKDRFSSSRLTGRQELYANNFGISGPYTPQMVVNGRVEFVGNDSATALRSIAAQSRSPRAVINLVRNGDHLRVSVTTSDRHALNVFCAITERDLTTKVGNGENRGRELHHTAVVRELTRLGALRDGHFESDVPLKLSSDWRPENLRAVVFVQNGNAGEISGVTQIPLH